jgi:drug/metabolite transporter (DMT)-like permease
MLTTHEGYQHRLGILLAFGAVIWSGTFNALAKGLTPFLSPVTLLLLSETLTAVFIIATYGFFPLFKKLLAIDGRSLCICLIYGLLNSAIAPMLWFTGLKYTSAINASILSSSDVVAVLVLSHFFLGERMSKMQTYGLFTVIIGIVTINFMTVQSYSVRLGDTFILLGSLVSGGGTVIFKKYLTSMMPELAIAIRNIAAVVVVGSIAMVMQLSILEEVAAFPVQKILLLLGFTFFSRYLSLSFFYEALERLPATTHSLILIASPLSGLVFAFLLLGEIVQPYQILGCLFIITGLILEHVSPKSSGVMQKLHGVFGYLRFKKHPCEISTVIPLLPRNV